MIQFGWDKWSEITHFSGCSYDCISYSPFHAIVFLVHFSTRPLEVAEGSNYRYLENEREREREGELYTGI